MGISWDSGNEWGFTMGCLFVGRGWFRFMALNFPHILQGFTGIFGGQKKPPGYGDIMGYHLDNLWDICPVNPMNLSMKYSMG